VNRASRIQPGLTELIVSRRYFAIWKALALAIDVRSWPEADADQNGVAECRSMVVRSSVSVILLTCDATGCLAGRQPTA